MSRAIHLRGAGGDVGVIRESGDRHVNEGRIAEVCGAVRKDALLHLGNEMNVLR